jgi:hypothetical protein
VRLFTKWKESWFYPVLVNLSTALILFLVMLTFKPVRYWLFPPETIQNYPLISTAEPYVNDSKDKLIIDYFIINRTGKEYTREDLVSLLELHNPNPDLSPSPDIELRYNRFAGQDPIGRIDSVYVDSAFNDTKGNLTAEVDKESNTVRIKIDYIAPRAVLKVNIVVADLPDLDVIDIKRTDKITVPLDYHRYQDACYTR